MKSKNTASTKKDQTKKTVEKKTPKIRINYKKKYKEALEKVHNLEINLVEQKRQNEIDVASFHEKARSFETKAQEQINHFKELAQKERVKEKENLQKYGSQKMLESSLEIISNIELAVKAGENDLNVANYVKGFKMLIEQFYENLQKYGVVKISPQVNDDFNSQLHHAIETYQGPKNKILEVKKEGFMLHERVLKPAAVVLGK